MSLSCFLSVTPCHDTVGIIPESLGGFGIKVLRNVLAFIGPVNLPAHSVNSFLLISMSDCCEDEYGCVLSRFGDIMVLHSPKALPAGRRREMVSSRTNARGRRTPAYADRGPIRKPPKSVVFVARFWGCFRRIRDGTSDFWPFPSHVGWNIAPHKAFPNPGRQKISPNHVFGRVCQVFTPFFASPRDIFVA